MAVSLGCSGLALEGRVGESRACGATGHVAGRGSRRVGRAQTEAHRRIEISFEIWESQLAPVAEGGRWRRLQGGEVQVRVKVVLL